MTEKLCIDNILNFIYNIWQVVIIMYKNDNNTVLKAKLTDDIKKDIIAFANSNNGMIYIGIDDNGNVVGLENAEKDLEELRTMIIEGISSDLGFDVHIENIDGKDIIKLNVLEASDKPIYLKDEGYKLSSIFVRSGELSVQASEDDIDAMLKKDNFLENNISSNQDLHFDYLKEIFEKNNIEIDDELFKSLHIMSLSGKYTNLGLLMSDECPYTIAFEIYNGNDKNEVKETKRFTGSLIKQLNDAFEFLDMYDKNEIKIANKISDLKLTLFNTVAHRNYLILKDVKHVMVDLFDDHYEVPSLFGATNIYLNAIFSLLKMNKIDF